MYIIQKIPRSNNRSRHSYPLLQKNAQKKNLKAETQQRKPREEKNQVKKA